MVKFSTDLWDGFEHISAKTELGLVVFKDVSEFAKKRAALETEYAKKLQELCKTVPGAGMFSKAAPIDKESKTLKSAFLSWLDEGVKLAGHHLEFANKINNDVVKPLEGFIKAKDAERKKAVAEGQKRTKVFLDAKANLDKSKEAYTRTMKEAEQATEAHEKTKTELESGPEAKKKQLGENEKRAGQKASQLVEKGKAAEAAYQKAVDTANEVSKETFTTHLPPIIDTLQQLEEERYTQAKAVIESFQREFRALPDLLIERAEELAKALDSLHVESDLEEFVQEKKGTATEPEVFKFVPFKEPVAATEGKTEEKNETTEDL